MRLRATVAGVATSFLFLTANLRSAEPSTLTLEAAVTRTLAQSPGVEVQREQLVQAVFAEQIAAGAFDFGLFSQVSAGRVLTPQVTAIPTAGGFIETVRQDTNRLTVGGVQRLRNGITVTPSATVVHYEANTGPLRPEARSDVRLAISIPLLRGRGRDAANTDEMVAKSASWATRALARQSVAERIARSAAAYWATLAAVQNLELLRESERRALDLSNQLEDLVRVGEIEAAILEEARADLLRRRGEVVGAALAVTVNWQRLAAGMGLGQAETEEMPKLEAGFPAVPSGLGWSTGSGGRFVALALAQRGDYQAAMQGQATNEIYLRRALSDLRPGLDLSVGVGYSGLTTEANGLTALESLGRNTAGPAGEVALKFDWPLANRSARGAVGLRRSRLRESELNTDELTIGISAETGIAVATLKAAADQYSVAQGTVAAFSTVLNNLRRKVSTGEATITTLVQNEDRFVQARQALINTSRNYASALIELRRVTGTLIRDGANDFELRVTDLVTLPSDPIASEPVKP